MLAHSNCNTMALKSAEGQQKYKALSFKHFQVFLTLIVPSLSTNLVLNLHV